MKKSDDKCTAFVNSIAEKLIENVPKTTNLNLEKVFKELVESLKNGTDIKDTLVSQYEHYLGIFSSCFPSTEFPSVSNQQYAASMLMNDNNTHTGNLELFKESFTKTDKCMVDIDFRQYLSFSLGDFAKSLLRETVIISSDIKEYLSSNILYRILFNVNDTTLNQGIADEQVLACLWAFATFSRSASLRLIEQTLKVITIHSPKPAFSCLGFWAYWRKRLITSNSDLSKLDGVSRILATQLASCNPSDLEEDSSLGTELLLALAVLSELSLHSIGEGILLSTVQECASSCRGSVVAAVLVIASKCAGEPLNTSLAALTHWLESDERAFAVASSSVEDSVLSVVDSLLDNSDGDTADEKVDSGEGDATSCDGDADCRVEAVYTDLEKNMDHVGGGDTVVEGEGVDCGYFVDTGGDMTVLASLVAAEEAMETPSGAGHEAAAGDKAGVEGGCGVVVGDDWDESVGASLKRGKQRRTPRNKLHTVETEIVMTERSETTNTDGSGDGSAARPKRSRVKR